MDLPSLPSMPSSGSQPKETKLHWTQMMFWFSSSLAILCSIGVVVHFLWEKVPGASLKVGSIVEISHAQDKFAPLIKKVADIRDRIIDARNSDDDEAFRLAMHDYEGVLQDFGIVQEALERRKLLIQKKDDSFYSYPNYDYDYDGGGGWRTYKREMPNQKGASSAKQ